MRRPIPGPRRVVLVRHAPASSRDPVRWPNDDLRPLRPDGRRRFRRAAPGLAGLLTAQGVVATSPLTRAQQTAEILAERWRPAASPEVWEELRPEATMASLLERVRRAVRNDRDLVVFGHEPQFSRWVGYALTGEALSALKFSKGGAVALAFAGAPRAGAGQLRWALTRGQLGDLGRHRRGPEDDD